jgi:pectate lyase
VSGGAHHLWFDHLDVSDGSDGNLDITQGSDYVTVSWTKFWYSGRERGHRFANLIGSADNSPIDVGKLRVTFHHNWWTENVEQRMPRSRYGLIHVFNNLYTPTDKLYCVNAGMGATLLVERNIFRGPRQPQDVSSTGNLLAIDNVYEDTTGDIEETGIGFVPPYDYELDPTEGLPEAIMQGVGVRWIGRAPRFASPPALTVYVNDVLQLTAMDTQFNSGRIALLVDRSDVSWDDVLVTNP